MKLPLGLFTYLRGKASLRHLQSYLVHLLVDVSDSLKAPRARTLAGCRDKELSIRLGKFFKFNFFSPRLIIKQMPDGELQIVFQFLHLLRNFMAWLYIHKKEVFLKKLENYQGD